MSDPNTRQPMCSGGKIQLPKINKDSKTMSAAIYSDDLCYNRCPNGEAPQVDKASGGYFCLVPSLVTYQIKQNPKEPTITNNSDGTETRVQKADEIDYTKSYTISCQSTDLTDSSNPQTGNTNNTMFGTPILLKSGLYEDPQISGKLRSAKYIPSGEYKWFCKRPMHGAPPLGALQSPYEAITQDMIDASAEIPEDCKSAIDNGSDNILFNSPTPAKRECKLKLFEDTVLSLTNGVTLEAGETKEIKTVTSLEMVSINDSKGVTVPGTATVTNPETGEVTSGKPDASAGQQEVELRPRIGAAVGPAARGQESAQAAALAAEQAAAGLRPRIGAAVGPAAGGQESAQAAALAEEQRPTIITPITRPAYCFNDPQKKNNPECREIPEHCSDPEKKNNPECRGIPTPITPIITSPWGV